MKTIKNEEGLVNPNVIYGKESDGTNGLTIPHMSCSVGFKRNGYRGQEE